MNSKRLLKKIDAYERLMRLDKPVGILLLMWPCLWGLLIAGKGYPPWPIVLVFVAGVVLMRSAGCVMNDIADRHYDGHVERTQNRPLISGELTVKEAQWLAASLSLAAFFLVCFLNTKTTILSFAALFLAMTYPLTKRFLAIPQAYLGIAFGFSIPMAFAAVNNAISPVAYWLLLANVFWTIAYDTEYAMVDREDDLKIGIQSSAIWFGQYEVLAIMFCYTTMLSLFVYVGQLMDFQGYFYVGLVAALALIILQYAMIKERAPSSCFKAFGMNHWIGCVLFLGVALDYWF